MTDAAELATLLETLKKPARSGGLFRKRSAKGTAARLEAARKYAELAARATPDAQSIEAFEKVAREFADDAAVISGYARMLAGAGRHADAINEYEELLRREPNDTRSLSDVASQYEATGRSDLAIERLRRAVDVLVGAGDLDGAVEATRRLISLEPKSLERATELVSILRARDPKLLVDALEHLANVYRDTEKLGQEAEACREILTIVPDRPDIQKRLAAIYTRILEVDPDDAEAWFGLATIDESLAGQLRVLLSREQAPAAAAPSGDAGEPHAAYALRKARELLDAGDVVGASLCLERVVSESDDPRERLRLAECYRVLHRDEDAARQALRALATAQAGRFADMADTALGWLSEAAPDVAAAIADTVFLNHRPASADTLYEELLRVWDESQERNTV